MKKAFVEYENSSAELLDAAEEGRFDIVEQLLAIPGIDVNAKDNYGDTALILAVKNGYVAVVKLLLANDDIDINAGDDGNCTALSWAAYNGNVAVVKLLLAKDLIDISAIDKDEYTALSWAKIKGNVAVVQLLLAVLDKDEGKSAKTLDTYAKVKEHFHLYPARSPDGKSVNYGIYQAGGRSYKQCIVGRIENISKSDRSDMGFLVSIPVPYLESYTRGSDRDPITLIRKYIKAICTLEPKDNYTDEVGLEFARKRIRIIIGLNIKDDHFNLDQKTRKIYKQVYRFSKKINAHLKDKRWPAWVVPTLWGIEHDLGPEFYFDSSKVDWENSRSDDLRQHLAQVIVPKNHVKMQFPFASMRSFLIESTACKIMLQELSALNKKVYFLTGDADLISLKPINKNTSVFNLVCDTVIAHPDTYFMRLGGAYGFENEDIAQHIMSKFKILPELYLSKSVLMTQLLRSLDTATRKIMSQIDQALAYYSEAHTYTVAEVFDQDGEYFVRAGNKASPDTKNSPITKSARNSKLNEPDFTSHITKAIIQEKHWVSKSKPENRKQKFLAERSTQLLTSSRHDLAVIKPSTMSLLREGAAGIQVIDEGLMSTAVLKEVIGKQHNTQLTASQLNSRFSEAGYGANGFHESVELLPIIRVPFVIYFLTGARRNQAARIAAAQADIARNAITSDGIPDDTTFQAIYKKLMDISERPESLLVNDPVIDIPGMRNIGTQRLNTHRQLILKAFFQLEHLLRWGVAMMHKIKSLTESYELKIKNKTVEGDDLLSGEIFKRKVQKGAPPTARPLDYSSADGAADSMIELSKDTKQAVSSNDLSVEEALAGHMQKFPLAEEENIAAAKKESLNSATEKGAIGPRNIPGWTIKDVPDVGNCFYEAIIHQMKTINHPFLFDVPVGGVPHLYLRNILNSSNEGEWAEDRTIDEFVTKVPVILAIVDTRRPDDGYVCYYLGADETVTTNPDIDLFLPTDKPIIRIAATGNHYLSIMKNPELNAGKLRDGYIAPELLNVTSPSFFARLARESLIERRHESADNQRAYDNRFGLVPWLN